MKLYIENKEDCERFAGHLAEFENELYIPAFPNEDEREPLENIIYRIENRGFPKTKIILETEDNLVVGGVITDYLAEDIAQPIYIVVRETYRGKGIGRNLFEESIRNYTHVFVEIDNPETVDVRNSAIDPRARKEMYERWGFKRVPIDYVQPPLSENSDYERNLILMYRANINKRVVKRFLERFYYGLNASDSEELAKMFRQIDCTSF